MERIKRSEEVYIDGLIPSGEEMRGLKVDQEMVGRLVDVYYEPSEKEERHQFGTALNYVIAIAAKARDAEKVLKGVEIFRVVGRMFEKERDPGSLSGFESGYKYAKSACLALAAYGHAEYTVDWRFKLLYPEVRSPSPMEEWG